VRKGGERKSEGRDKMGTETGRKWRGGRKGERFHLAWRENR